MTCACDKDGVCSCLSQDMLGLCASSGDTRGMMRTGGLRLHLRGSWPRPRMGIKPSTALGVFQAVSLPPPRTPFKASQGGGDLVWENLDKIYGFELEETDQLEWSRLSFPQQSTNKDLRKLSGGEVWTYYLSARDFGTQHAL